MQVIMALNGSRRQSNGNRRQYHAAVNGNGRQSPFIPCFSKIPLFIGEFSVPFFDFAVEGSSIDILNRHISQVLVIPKCAPHIFGSTFARCLYLGFYGRNSFLVKTLLGKIREMLGFRLRLFFLNGHDILGVNSTNYLGEVPSARINVVLTAVVVIDDFGIKENRFTHIAS